MFNHHEILDSNSILFNDIHENLPKVLAEIATINPNITIHINLNTTDTADNNIIIDNQYQYPSLDIIFYEKANNIDRSSHNINIEINSLELENYEFIRYGGATFNSSYITQQDSHIHQANYNEGYYATNQIPKGSTYARITEYLTRQSLSIGTSNYFDDEVFPIGITNRGKLMLMRSLLKRLHQGAFDQHIESKNVKRQLGLIFQDKRFFDDFYQVLDQEKTTPDLGTFFTEKFIPRFNSNTSITPATINKISIEDLNTNDDNMSIKKISNQAITSLKDIINNYKPRFLTQKPNLLLPYYQMTNPVTVNSLSQPPQSNTVIITEEITTKEKTQQIPK